MAKRDSMIISERKKKMIKRALLSGVLALTLMLSFTIAEAAKEAKGSQETMVDSELPGYKPAKGISGNLNSIGSDTLNNLMNLWVEGFKKVYPSVIIGV